MPHLDLSDDDEAAALTRELHEIVENDRYPFSHPHAEGDPRQAQTGAGAQAPAAAKGLCAAVERQIQAARLGDAPAVHDGICCRTAAPVGKSIPSEAVKNGGRRRHWLDYAGVALAGFASIAASFAAKFKINLISRLRRARMMTNVALRGLACRAFLR
jgi:hypothetical protein